VRCCELEPNGTFYVEAFEPSVDDKRHTELIARLESLTREVAALHLRQAPPRGPITRYCWPQRMRIFLLRIYPQWIYSAFMATIVPQRTPPTSAVFAILLSLAEESEPGSRNGRRSANGKHGYQIMKDVRMPAGGSVKMGLARSTARSTA